MRNSRIRRCFPALMVASVVFFAVSAAAGPAIKIAAKEFDFGKTLQHVKVSHDFVIESIGDDTLIIHQVVPGCGCTKAPLQDSVLAPGEKTVLTIVFSTKSYSGRITKHPYLLTNISDEKVKLTITAEVVIDPAQLAPLKVSPFKLEIPPNPTGGNNEALFLIQNQGPRDLKVTLVDRAPDLIEVTLPQGIKAGETAQGVVSLKKSAGSRMIEKSITFELSDPDRSRYSLPVSRLPAAGSGK